MSIMAKAVPDAAIQRFEGLDQLRGVAVVLIHFVDLFLLLWDRASGFDWFGSFIIDRFPVYGIPPILFAFSTGLGVMLWKPRHREIDYLFRRSSLLMLSGFFLSYYVDGSADAWGLFEMIALLNIIIFFVDSVPLTVFGISMVLVANAFKPPFYSFGFPRVPYFFPDFELLPRIVSQSLVSGLFPLIPFLGWGLWGLLVGKIRGRESHLLLAGIIPATVGLGLRVVQPFEYNQAGNVYSTSMIVFSCGACSLSLWLLTKFRIAPLARFGMYAWRLTFWRYFALYMPFVWFGLFRSLPNMAALVVSVLSAIAQIAITYVRTDRLRELLSKPLTKMH